MTNHKPVAPSPSPAARMPHDAALPRRAPVLPSRVLQSSRVPQQLCLQFPR